MKSDNLHQNHRNRIRERLYSESDVLSDHELLEIVLFATIRRKNTNPIAHMLLNEFGSLRGVMQAEVEALRRVPSMTEDAANALRAFGTLCRRLDSRDPEPTFVRNTTEAGEVLLRGIPDLGQRKVWILGIDANARATYLGPIECRPNYCYDLTRILPVLVAIKPARVIFCRPDEGAPDATEEDWALADMMPGYLSALGIEFDDLILIGKRGRLYSFRLRSFVDIDRADKTELSTLK